MNTACFIEAIDVLFPRGNRLFGEAGSYGEALMPPWPSVAAGAIRSHILVRDGVDLAAFAQGKQAHPELGTPEAPGGFRLVDFGLARRSEKGCRRLYPLPADLVVHEHDGKYLPRRLKPTPVADGLLGSFALERLPVMAVDRQAKTETGLWLEEAGWRDYLAGQMPAAEDLVETGDLWRIDERIGVGLDAGTRSAREGHLFSMQGVALKEDVGFLALVDGVDSIGEGLLRFGGDGRGTRMEAVDYARPEPDYQAICAEGRCRIVLTTPGIFPDGWRLPGDRGEAFSLAGVSARVSCAAVPRAGVVSGWDLARRRPKPAVRYAPAGSVYWLDDLEATPESLMRLVDQGLWPEEEPDEARRAEGFNRFTFATY